MFVRYCKKSVVLFFNTMCTDIDIFFSKIGMYFLYDDVFSWGIDMEFYEVIGVLFGFLFLELEVFGGPVSDHTDTSICDSE